MQTTTTREKAIALNIVKKLGHRPPDRVLQMLIKATKVAINYHREHPDRPEGEGWEYAKAIIREGARV